MSNRSDRGPMIASQDGGTPLKSARVHSPAVAVAQAAFYNNSNVDSPRDFAAYDSVILRKSYQQMPATTGSVVVSNEFHHDQQQRGGIPRDLRDLEFAQQLQQQQQQSRTHILMASQNAGVELDASGRPIFSSSPHHAAAAAMYNQQRSSPRPSPRPPPTSIASQDSGSASKRPRLMSDFAQPLRVDVDTRREITQSSSGYKPQVEAISPTLPIDDALENEIKHAREELLGNLSRLDFEINNIQHSIEKLKRKQQQLEDEAKKPVEERMSEPEVSADVRNQMGIVQTIHIDNKRKAEISHAQFAKLGKATLLPLYVQPSDTLVYEHNKAKFAIFKKQLIAFLKRRHRATVTRENYWTEKYEKLLQSWVKRLERVENSAKRRLKDAKAREVFEKLFPELKKQREDRERIQRCSGTRLGGYVRSEANIEQIVDGLQTQEEEERKMRSLTVIPPMLLDARQRKLRYVNENGLIDDPIPINQDVMSRANFWTAEEKEIFKEKYLQRPKNFGFIASALENKTSQDCVLFYYSSKKSVNYKQMVRRNNAGSRKRKFRPAAAAAAAAAALAARELKEEKLQPVEPEPPTICTAEDKKTVAAATESIEKPRSAAAADDVDEPPAAGTPRLADLSAGGEPTGSAADVPAEDKVIVPKTEDDEAAGERNATPVTEGKNEDRKPEAGGGPEPMETSESGSGNGTTVFGSGAPLNAASLRPVSRPATPSFNTAITRPASRGSASRPPSGPPPGGSASGRPASGPPGGRPPTDAPLMQSLPQSDGRGTPRGGPVPMPIRFDIGLGAKLDEIRRNADISSINCGPGMTAAHLIEAIIAHETARDSLRDAAAAAAAAVAQSDAAAPRLERPRTGSRTSLCSDNTSDTLSADEREEDEQRPRKSRGDDGGQNPTQTGTAMPQPNAGPLLHNRAPSLPILPNLQNDRRLTATNFLPNMIRDGLAGLPTIRDQLLGQHQGGLSLSDGAALLTAPRLMSRQNNAVTAAFLGLDKLPAKTAATLRVRDVIHSAIEENLLSRGPEESEELWRLYTQQGLGGPGQLRGLNAVHGNSVEALAQADLAQDLSCRGRYDRAGGAQGAGRESGSNSTAQRSWTPELGGHGQFSGRSPPPAHSHYVRPAPAAVAPQPPMNRHDDPLYHLAEVAVQRSRVEIPADRHRSSPNYGAARHAAPPQLSDQMSMPHPNLAGSITLGTPRHLVPASTMLPMPRLPVSFGNPPALVSKPQEALSAQVMELAQASLKYMYAGQPDALPRAIVESAMATVNAGLFGANIPAPTSNASHNILMGDYMTAQQMQQLNQTSSSSSTQPRHRHRVSSLEAPQQQQNRDTAPSPLQRVIDSSSARFADSKYAPAVTMPGRPSAMPERPPLLLSAASIMSQLSPTSQSNARQPSSYTAASVINAIIVNQISRDVKVTTASGGSGASLISDAMAFPPSTPLHRGVVNGSVAPQDGLMRQEQTFTDRLEMERTVMNMQRSAAVAKVQAAQLQRGMPQNAASSGNSVPMSSGSAAAAARAVTLGEHIDEMIQKDFTNPRDGEQQIMRVETSRSSAIDLNTKNALRSFLTNSSDFNAESVARQSREPRSNNNASPHMTEAPASAANDVRRSPAAASMPQQRPQRDSFERDSRSLSSSLVNSVLQQINSSNFSDAGPPRLPVHSPPATSQPAPLPRLLQQNGGTLPPPSSLLNTFQMALLGMNSAAMGSFTLPIPTQTMAPSGLAALFESQQAAAAAAPLGIPSLLSSIAAGLNPGSGIGARLPMSSSAAPPPPPSRPETSTASSASDAARNAAHQRPMVTMEDWSRGSRPAENQDQPASAGGMNWKLKMARDHQRLEQERVVEAPAQSGISAASSGMPQGSVADAALPRMPRSRPSSRPVTPADDPEAAARSRNLGNEHHGVINVAGPAGPVSTNMERPGARSTPQNLGPSWLPNAGLRDAVSDAGSNSSKSMSPRSPRVSGGGPEKPLSTIAASHQTMSSLLSIKPNFTMEKVVSIDNSAPDSAKPAVSPAAAAKPAGSVPMQEASPLTPSQSTAMVDAAVPNPSPTSAARSRAGTPAPAEAAATPAPTADSSAVPVADQPAASEPMCVDSIVQDVPTVTPDVVKTPA